MSYSYRCLSVLLVVLTFVIHDNSFNVNQTTNTVHSSYLGFRILPFFLTMYEHCFLKKHFHVDSFRR